MHRWSQVVLILLKKEKFVACFGFKWNNNVKTTKSVKDKKNGKSKSEYVPNGNRSTELHDCYASIVMQIPGIINEMGPNLSQTIIGRIQALMKYISEKMIKESDLSS